MPASGSVESRKYTAYFEYDFAKDGGAVGDIPLRGPVLTAGAIIRSGVIKVSTGVTSGGAATAGIGAKVAEDILADGVVTGLTVGLHDVVPVDSATTSVELTANGGLTMTVGTAALTAGKLVVCLDYYLPS